MKMCGKMGFGQSEVICFLEELSVLHQFEQDMQNTSLQMNIYIRKRKKHKLYSTNKYTTQSRDGNFSNIIYIAI